MHPFNRDVLQAGLTIVYPAERTSVVDIRYDFNRRDLAFHQVIGGDRKWQADIRFSFDTFAKVSAPQIYDAIESFVQAVLGAKLL